ncbi:hypothetical protein [Halothermothrix orenii]|uniref:Outer membrane protein beta-barrel domain-containing protein n=1 Tax=Halothermothrix orenii (strain H 168 / OCM 544 / DSM 9562) TaxID=373903 RepID=B8CYN2_HALOH|nr:hypothetical protein [Halothermothrix orenii]ACL70401.1 hypothetical protein Hore_16510 [Halothermothrix orenii H 168]
MRRLISKPEGHAGIFFIVVFVVMSLVSIRASAGPELDTVHYIVSGQGTTISSLKLDLGYKLDDINNLDLLGVYNGEDIKMQGTWNIRFLKRSLYSLQLGLSLTTGLNESGFGKAIGLSGEGIYLVQNRYFWNIDYFIDEKAWVYGAGLGLPVTPDTFLTLGVGNSYWDRNDINLNIGIKVDL